MDDSAVLTRFLVCYLPFELSSELEQYADCDNKECDITDTLTFPDIR